VGIFLGRHGGRFYEGVGSRRRFSRASGGRSLCASRLEAAASALACQQSRTRKAVRITSLHRTQAVAMASAEAMNGTGRRDRRICWSFMTAEPLICNERSSPPQRAGRNLFSPLLRSSRDRAGRAHPCQDYCREADFDELQNLTAVSKDDPAPRGTGPPNLAH